MTKICTFYCQRDCTSHIKKYKYNKSYYEKNRYKVNCNLCNKNFATKQGYKIHLTSKKHKENIEKNIIKVEYDSDETESEYYSE